MVEEGIVRVLLVDDDERYFVWLRRKLAEAPGVCLRLEREDDYEAALEAMQHAQHDAYLLDCRLGAQDGVALMRDAIASGCRAPILLLTGLGDRSVDVAAMQAGADDCLDKHGLSVPLLERSIRYALARRRAEALRISETRCRLISEGIHDAIVVVDAAGTVQFINAAIGKVNNAMDFVHERQKETMDVVKKTARDAKKDRPQATPDK